MTHRELVSRKWEEVRECNVIGRHTVEQIQKRRGLLTAQFYYEDADIYMRRARNWRDIGNLPASARCVAMARQLVRLARNAEVFAIGGSVPNITV